MAMQQPNSFLEEDDSNSSSNSCLLLDDDALFCQEEEEQRYWGEEEEEEEEDEDEDDDDVAENVAPFVVVEQDLFWEDEELMFLFSKEQEQSIMEKTEMKERSEAVEWMVKAISQIGFSSPLTAVLAVNYLDRFLISSFHVQKDNKPWMIQLVAVTCLSLAAKVEEIHVPLLLDLQVGDAKYVFEAKTIQRMEVVVLSTLKWKMHPVTPLSFLDHIVRRLGLKTEIHFDFLTRCQLLILSLLSDSRCMGCLPSVLAAATMMHVIDEVEPSKSPHYKNQLLHVLRMTKEKVDGCYRLIEGIISSSSNNRKRKLESPLLSSDEEEYSSSNDSSWSSSLKRSRLFMEQKTKQSCGKSKFASLNHAFAISSPR